MTTNVKIEAHCGTDEEVQIAITEGGKTVETFELLDGEKAERLVYDDREISVKEVKKTKAD